MRPVAVSLKKKSRCLVLEYQDGKSFSLSCELLRVYSPSAEVRGHGPGQEILQTGKENVNIDAVEPVGSYALKLCFDDGHSSGIYTWDYLYQLGENRERHWQSYLAALGKSRLQTPTAMNRPVDFKVRGQSKNLTNFLL